MEQQQTEQPADSPRPYVFDFNAEVERARAEYPEETGNVRMFLLPNDENALRQTDEWELIAKLGSQFISGDYNRPAMLILKLGAGDRPLDDPEKDAFFTFWHELGHAIITRGLLDDGGYTPPRLSLSKRGHGNIGRLPRASGSVKKPPMCSRRCRVCAEGFLRPTVCANCPESVPIDSCAKTISVTIRLPGSIPL